jgi:gliding motility-associated-like protein
VNTLSPIAKPQTTTSYAITVTDTMGRPKPVGDTTIITVIPVLAYAGNDTTIVAGQPLQLTASGGTSYVWSPATGLNNPNVANPVAILGAQYDSITYHVVVQNMEGCTAGAEVKVIVFKTRADIFIPTAFTPDNNGLNDVLLPKPVGIKQFLYFRIYNRWGQLLYHTSTVNKGWDGRFDGKLQPTGTYVYITQGIDYTGKPILKKGTIALIY